MMICIFGRNTKNIAASALLIWLSLSFVALPAYCQKPKQTPKKFDFKRFDEESVCGASKGRLQDQGACQPKVTDQIILTGKDAVPVLISQITDTQEMKHPIYDFWSRMTFGDVAAFVLEDLFTDSDWEKFNMPGLEEIRPKCEGPAEQCWDRLIKRRGRKFVHDKWLAAWRANQDRVYWDAKARCFRLSAKQALRAEWR
jgi:hypothetical protein